jgi:hypothetical protein
LKIYKQNNLPDKLDQLNTRIKYTDDKINKLVYQLYGLSEEEIGIVEGNNLTSLRSRQRREKQSHNEASIKIQSVS